MRHLTVKIQRDNERITKEMDLADGSWASFETNQRYLHVLDVSGAQEHGFTDVYEWTITHAEEPGA